MRSFWERHFLGIEAAVALALTGAFAFWGFTLDGFETVDALLAENRSEIYGSLATLLGSLLGFVIVTVSIVVSYTRTPHMAVVRQSKHYQTLWLVFLSAIRYLGIAVLAALIALVIDRPNQPSRWAMIAVFGAVLVAALRTFRSVWVLERIIGVVMRDGKRERRSIDQA